MNDLGDGAAADDADADAPVWCGHWWRVPSPRELVDGGDLAIWLPGWVGPHALA